MKQCHNCNAIFDDSFKYCNNCGTLYEEIKVQKPSFGRKLGSVGIGVLYVLFFFAVQSLASTIYAVILTARYILENGGLKNYASLFEVMQQDLLSHVSEISIISAVLTTVLLILFFRIRKKSLAIETECKKTPFFAIAGVGLLGAVLNFAVSLFQFFVPLPESLIKTYEEMYSYIGEGNIILEFIAVAICAPVVEEIVFRGLCYGSMRKFMSPSAAAIISAVIFGIAHGNIISFVYTSILGLLMAYLYEKSGSLFVPMVLHFGFNAGSYVVQLMPQENETLFYAVIFFVSAVFSVALGMLTVKAYSKEDTVTV